MRRPYLLSRGRTPNCWLDSCAVRIRQPEVRVVVEEPLRVVEHVGERGAELELPRAAHREVLEHREVVVRVGGAAQVREDVVPVRARRRQREAAGVQHLVAADVLSRGSQVSTGIAGDVRRAGQERAARQRFAVGARAGDAEVDTGRRQRLQGCAADVGRHAGELPAAENRLLETGRPVQCRKQVAVADVQHVRAVVAEHAVGRIPDITRRLRRRPLGPAADAHRLRPRVRRRVAELRAGPAQEHLQRVVVLVVRVLRHRQGAAELPVRHVIERIAGRVVDHRPEWDDVQVVDAVVQQPIALAADVAGLDRHLVRQATLHREAPALGPRLLVISRQDRAVDAGLRVGIDVRHVAEQRAAAHVRERDPVRQVDEARIGALGVMEIEQAVAAAEQRRAVPRQVIGETDARSPEQALHFDPGRGNVGVDVGPRQAAERRARRL